jgi:excisionase family DNA binding protein
VSAVDARESARAPIERLSYSIQDVADSTGLSYETVRQAIKRNELVAKYSGSKAVIRREDVIAWLDSLPDERARTSSG